MLHFQVGAQHRARHPEDRVRCDPASELQLSGARSGTAARYAVFERGLIPPMCSIVSIVAAILVGNLLQIGIDHLAHERVEFDFVAPAELCARPGGVAAQ